LISFAIRLGLLLHMIGCAPPPLLHAAASSGIETTAADRTDLIFIATPWR